MIDIFNLPLIWVLNFFLILARVGSILFFGPVFNSSLIPSQLKVGLALTLAVLIYPFVSKITFPIDKLDIINYTLLLALELGIGITIGFLSTFIFAAIQTAGQLIGFSMGLAIANVLDPITNEQVSEISHLQNIFALMIFLLLNGHHIFIESCMHSFTFIPLGGFFIKMSFLKLLLKFGSEIFIIALQISAPMVVSLYIVDLSFGIISRIAPQANIMIVGLPIKLFVGFFFLMMSMPLFVFMFSKLFKVNMEQIFMLIKSFGF